jgi:hypothetical protein
MPTSMRRAHGAALIASPFFIGFTIAGHAAVCMRCFSLSPFPAA